MKKVFLWLIPSVFVMAFLIGTIFVLVVNNNKKDTKTYAQSISCKYEKLTFIKDCTYSLTKNDFIILPTKCNQKVMISTNDNHLLDVNTLTGEIIAKEVGVCKIFASIKSSEKDVLKIEIDVEIKQQSKSQKEVNLSFALSEGIAVIAFEPTSTFADYTCNVVSGIEKLAIAEFELGKMTIVLNSVGTATICLENSVEKIIYIIEIV